MKVVKTALAAHPVKTRRATSWILDLSGQGPEFWLLIPIFCLLPLEFWPISKFRELTKFNLRVNPRYSDLFRLIKKEKIIRQLSLAKLLPGHVEAPAVSADHDFRTVGSKGD